MELGFYSANEVRHKHSPALAISVALHAAAFAGLMLAPAIELPQREKSEYQQVIAGKEDKLVWYKFDKELPEIRPPDVKADRRPVRAKSVAKQQIVALPKRAPERTQIVLAPAPELPDTPPLESPNLLAIRMPPRPFTAPPDLVKPKLSDVAPAPDAPVLATQPLQPVSLPQGTKIRNRFVPPPKRVPAKIREVELPSDAPQLLAESRAQVWTDYKFRTPSRPFTAPPVNAAEARNVSVDAPPAFTPDLLSANLPDLNTAVVGLNPSTLPAPLPASSSAAQFSAAPKMLKDGSDAAGDAKGLSVPDLFVRAAPRDLKAEIRAQAYAAPTSAATLRDAARRAQGAVTGIRVDPLPPPRASATAMKVSGAPDPRFNGRDVYMMAIQMANLTSYSGSWLLWYADRTARETGLAPIAAPVAHRKVDPKYIAAAVAEHVQGKVQLLCVIGKDGRVGAVELVRGIDDRLNASAMEALRKWEFEPATREGEAVAVDVLVEIPFRLNEPVR